MHSGRDVAMRGFRGGLWLFAAWSAAAASAAGGAERHSLRYEYRDGEKSAYDVSVELELTTTASLGDQKEEASVRTTSFKMAMDVVDRVEEGKPPRLGVTFRDLKVDQEITGPEGEVTVEIRGRDIVVRKKGAEPIVDTKKGEGRTLAAGLLREFAFLGSEGILEVDPDTGRVTSVSGSAEFESFLSQKTGPGLFLLETPPESVAVGETWSSAPTLVDRLRGLDLRANPLSVSSSFTLASVEEELDRRTAEIAAKSDLTARDLSAKSESEALGNQDVTIQEVRREAEGSIIFDMAKGKVVRSDLTVTLSVSMEMDFEGEKVRTRTEATGRVRTSLAEAPAGAGEAGVAPP
jgi:hypothetical protein